MEQQKQQQEQLQIAQYDFVRQLRRIRQNPYAQIRDQIQAAQLSHHTSQPACDNTALHFNPEKNAEIAQKIAEHQGSIPLRRREYGLVIMQHHIKQQREQKEQKETLNMREKDVLRTVLVFSDQYDWKGCRQQQTGNQICKRDRMFHPFHLLISSDFPARVSAFSSFIPLQVPCKYAL